MKFKDFLLITFCCLIWGINVPLSGWCVRHIPPLFFAFLRFALIGLILSPKLFPIPRQIGLVFIIAMCIGGFNFMLLFMALKQAKASSVAIVGQLGLPMATILSIIFLGETVRWRRILGMTLAFIGVMIVIIKPDEKFSIEIGLLFSVGSAFAGALGTIFMKRLEPIGALQLQSWVALFSVFPLSISTLLFEDNQMTQLINAGPVAWSALLFSVLAVSIIGHSSYYYLVKKYDVTLVMPFTLMVPIWAVIMSIIILGEDLNMQIIFGGILCIIGVGVIAIRENTKLDKESLSITREK